MKEFLKIIFCLLFICVTYFACEEILIHPTVLSQPVIIPHPDGVFVECSSYREGTAEKIDVSCIGFGFPPMRTWKLIWGSDCVRVTYRNGTPVAEERLSGEQSVTEKPDDCAHD